MINRMEKKTGIGILALHIPISGDHSWFLDILIDTRYTIAPGLKRKGQYLCLDV